MGPLPSGLRIRHGWVSDDLWHLVEIDTAGEEPVVFVVIVETLLLYNCHIDNNGIILTTLMTLWEYVNEKIIINF